MDYERCEGEYWQPNHFLGTGWVCSANGHDVRVIFWICVVQMIFAGMNTLSAFTKKICPRKKDPETPNDNVEGNETIKKTQK